MKNYDNISHWALGYRAAYRAQGGQSVRSVTQARSERAGKRSARAKARAAALVDLSDTDLSDTDLSDTDLSGPPDGQYVYSPEGLCY
jgi:hypothetical protein